MQLNASKIKYSELLKTTDDPETYVRGKIKKVNVEYRVGRITFNLTADFNKKVKHIDDESSASNRLNIGYSILRHITKELFQQKTGDRKITCVCFTIFALSGQTNRLNLVRIVERRVESY